MIQLRKTLETARSILFANNIKFSLIGGFALSNYGIHRATRDIDLLIDGSAKERIKDLFKAAGFVLYHETNEILQFEGLGYLDVLLANRPLSLQMLSESKNSTYLQDIPVASVEAIVGLKIQAYRNDPSRTLKDKSDIQELLKIKDIDLKIVKKYADLFDAWTEIQELMKI